MGDSKANNNTKPLHPAWVMTHPWGFLPNLQIVPLKSLLFPGYHFPASGTSGGSVSPVVSFLSLPPPSRRKRILHSINQPVSLSLTGLETRPQNLATTFYNFSEPRPFVLFILAPRGPSQHAQLFSVFLQPLGSIVFT